MKIERLFSGDSHLPFILLFAILALLLFAFDLPSFLQSPGLLSLVTAIFGTLIFYSGLALNRKQWLIAPIVGIAVTFVSTLYTTTVYPVVLCGSIQVSQGYPYPWIRRFSLPSNYRCPVYYEPIAGGLRQVGLYPSPIIVNAGFIADTVFYTLLTLAILELVAAARLFRSTLKQETRGTSVPLVMDKSRLPKLATGIAAS